MDLFEDNNALFSEDRKYRYVLWRIWDRTRPMIMFIGLNPSTANENDDDPTIRRVKEFARQWGYGGIYMLNLFTFITAYPKELRESNYPTQLADWYIRVYSEKSEKVILMCGSFPIAEKRLKEVKANLSESFCFGKNKNGSPKHPLYLKKDTKLIKF